jgi:hypothetical protein
MTVTKVDTAATPLMDAITGSKTVRVRVIDPGFSSIWYDGTTERLRAGDVIDITPTKGVGFTLRPVRAKGTRAETKEQWLSDLERICGSVNPVPPTDQLLPFEADSMIVEVM